MKNRILLAAAILLATCSAQAQFNETNNLFYHAVRSPQSNILNPAFFPTNNSFFLMLPGVDLQVGMPLEINKVLYYNKKKHQTVINLNRMLDSLNDGDRFRMGAEINLLGFGFKAKDLFFTFNTRLINNVNAYLPMGTIRALQTGNVSNIGVPIPRITMLDGDLLNAQSYLETSLGVGYTIRPINLTVGLRAKLLYGVLNVQTDNTYIEFETDPNLDQLKARMYYEIQTATFAPWDTNTNSFNIKTSDLFKIGSANTGMAFDLGARWDMGPFSFSFAINDISTGIHWKSNVSTWRPRNGVGNIEFNGLDISEILNHGSMNLDSLTTYLTERLSNMTPVKKDSGDYWYSIPTKINLGASYSFLKMFRAGVLFHGQLDRGLTFLTKSNSAIYDSIQDIANTFRWNTTLSLSANLFNWAEVVVGNSLVYDGNKLDVINPGFGIILTPFTVLQVYTMFDYVSSFYITESKAFNVRVGLNLLIGKGGRTTVKSIEDDD